MTKVKMTVVMDSGTAASLDKMAERYGMTKNLIVAAAGYELARVRPENLWHALGRIAEGEGLALSSGDGAGVARAIETGKARPMLGR